MSEEWCLCKNCGRVQPLETKKSLWETDDSGELVFVKTCGVCGGYDWEAASATDQYLSEWILKLQDLVNRLHEP